jgi:hypothetical protein
MSNPIVAAFAILLGGGLRMITVLLTLCIIFVPLGIWKAVEIIIWIFKTIAPTP